MRFGTVFAACKAIAQASLAVCLLTGSLLIVYGRIARGQEGVSLGLEVR